MRTVPFIFLLISASKAEKIYNSRCNTSPNTTTTLEPTYLEGRYTVEFCTEMDKNVSQWKLTLEYYNNTEKCPKGLYRTGITHSNFKINVINDFNCTHVCFSTPLDLIFRGCYHIKTSLHYKNATTWTRPDDIDLKIANNVTLKNYTSNYPLPYNKNYAGGRVLLFWNLGYVPAMYYTVDIWNNVTHKTFNTTCNVSGKFESKVRCEAWLPPGCYKATLWHTAHWTASTRLFGNITLVALKFCQSMPYTPVASSSPMEELPTALGIAALVLLAVAACCVVRRRYAAAWQRRVRDYWLNISPKGPLKPSNVNGNILLLYARDCALFKCAAERLGALVHRATGCPVIDLYSGASVRLWASGGDEWLRLMLERDDTRVLLLQSPAGTLFAAELAETPAGPALAARCPRVSWRRPHAGDALLALALRQLAAAPTETPYKKHYVANISSLGTDMAPSVTPYRRYTLPATAATLLRDLAPSLNFTASLDLEPGLEKASDLILVPAPELEWNDLEPLLQQFREAADAYTDHVRDHPNYLADELLFDEL